MVVGWAERVELTRAIRPTTSLRGCTATVKERSQGRNEHAREKQSHDRTSCLDLRWQRAPQGHRGETENHEGPLRLGSGDSPRRSSSLRPLCLSWVGLTLVAGRRQVTVRRRQNRALQPR